MTLSRKKIAVLLPVQIGVLALALPLAGCGGTSHERTVVVVPEGSKVVCSDGTSQPCPSD